MLIKAYNGTGDKKVFVGDREVVRPTDIDEAVGTYGKDKVLKGFWKSEVIAVQAAIRAGANGKSGGTKAKVDAIIVKARQEKADGDSTLYDKLVALDVISE
jgi:hypothetical protein